MKNKLVENFNKATKAIYEHVDLIDDCNEPIDMYNNLYWHINGTKLYFGYTKKDFLTGYCHPIELYNTEVVHRGKELTLIYVYDYKAYCCFETNKEVDI